MLRGEGPLMAWWRAVGGELSALGALALSMPLDLLLPQRPFDPTAPYPTPVVFVHGVCGAASNFLVLRTSTAVAIAPPTGDVYVPGIAPAADSPGDQRGRAGRHRRRRRRLRRVAERRPDDARAGHVP